MGRVAMVVSTVGYHWEEVFGGYWGLVDGGCSVDVFTVNGDPPRPDLLSLTPTGPGALMGLGMPRRIGPTTSRGKALSAVLAAARPLPELDVERTDALYLPGGHGALFDMNRNPRLHAVIRRLYDRGCILSGVCHATSAFAFVEAGGASIVRGHEMTGFPHALDRSLIALGLVRREFLPLPLINDDELRRAGAHLSRFAAFEACLNPRLLRTSLPFITGMGPKAAARVARAVVHALARRAETRNRTAGPFRDGQQDASATA